jgi:hypothetical protein
MSQIRIVRNQIDFLPPTGIYLTNKKGRKLVKPSWDAVVQYQSRDEYLERKSAIGDIAVGPARVINDDDSRDDMEQYTFPNPDFAMHRHLGTTVKDSPAEFYEVVKTFVEDYGDFFAGDVTKKVPVWTLGEWRSEWIVLREWALKVEAALKSDDSSELNMLRQQFNRETRDQNIAFPIPEKFRLYTSVEIVSTRGAKFDTGIRVNGFAGWCWALVVRDLFHGVQYNQCSNYKSANNPNGCIQELPSVTPFGKSGKQMKHCSNRCRKASSRREEPNNG